MGLSIHLTFSHCAANPAQIHSVYVAMYLSSRVVRSYQHLLYFWCQHDLEVLGSAPTRKKPFYLSWWFSTASLQICFSESELGHHLRPFLQTSQAAGSKAFPVNDFTCGRKGHHSFGLMRHSVLASMWPALSQFALLFLCVSVCLCARVCVSWSQCLALTWVTGGLLPNGKTRGQMVERWVTSTSSRSPWNRVARVVKQWKVTVYLNQRAICAPGGTRTMKKKYKYGDKSFTSFPTKEKNWTAFLKSK